MKNVVNIIKKKLRNKKNIKKTNKNKNIKVLTFEYNNTNLVVKIS